MQKFWWINEWHLVNNIIMTKVFLTFFVSAFFFTASSKTALLTCLIRLDDILSISWIRQNNKINFIKAKVISARGHALNLCIRCKEICHNYIILFFTITNTKEALEQSTQPLTKTAWGKHSAFDDYNKNWLLFSLWFVLSKITQFLSVALINLKVIITILGFSVS